METTNTNYALKHAEQLIKKFEYANSYTHYAYENAKDFALICIKEQVNSTESCLSIIKEQLKMKVIDRKAYMELRTDIKNQVNHLLDVKKEIELL